MFGGKRSAVESVVENVKASYSLGTIVYGPSKIHFYGLLVAQRENMTISVDENDRYSYQSGTTTTLRRKQGNSALNSVKPSPSRSLNTASHLLQKARKTTVKNFIAQINLPRELKIRGTLLTFVKPLHENQHLISVVVNCDASRSKNHEQHELIVGLPTGELK